MANVISELFKDIADSIRYKTGETGTMKPAEFPAEIMSIVTGGGSSDLVKHVTFIGADGTQLYRMPVLKGDDCKDPVAKGNIATPTKESTVDKVYTFSGWSLTADGSASDDALKEVTEDRTVYAAFAKGVRKYTVRFYDGDTLIKTEQIAYGGSSSYEYEKTDYIFTGWNPEPTNIVSDLDCYAQFEEAVSFADMSWEKIASVCERGLADKAFAIGDTKTITLKKRNSVNHLDVQLQIVAFNVDSLADESGYASMTLMFVPVLNTSRDLNVGVPSYTTRAWSKSYARTSLNGNFLNECVPSDLKEHIKLVSKKAREYSNVWGEVVSNDYVFIPSQSEMNYSSYFPEGRYPYFASDEARKKTLIDGTETSYPVRDTKDGSNTYGISQQGSLYLAGSSTYYSIGVNEYEYPIAFCI